MFRSKLFRLVLGAAAVGAGLAGLRARRERGPDSFLPTAPMPPTPAEPAGGPARLPTPEAVPDPGPAAASSQKAEPAKQPSKAKSSAKPKAAAKPRTAAKPAAKPRPKPAAKAAVSSRTREELYREAKKLGIEGRSKMSKGELERAIAKASG